MVYDRLGNSCGYHLVGGGSLIRNRGACVLVMQAPFVFFYFNIMYNKNNEKNKATIEDLAGMVQKGFAEVNEKVDKLGIKTEDGLKDVSNRLDVLEHELLSIKKDLENVIYRHEFELIKERVKNLENRLTTALGKKKIK